MSSTEIDYTSVNQYWDQIQPSVLGPYMMDGFGFPSGAGFFRFRFETRIVDRLIKDVQRDGALLDLGCGVGYWAEHFARHFNDVIAVEGSKSFAEALEHRCAPFPNIKVVLGDVMKYEPEEQCSLVFLGGMLMYLNEADVIALLRKLIPHLKSNGRILCRESTVREGAMTRQGSYQAVYRSVATYGRIFKQCGLSIVHEEINTPYALMQMGCEWVKSWKRIMPPNVQCLPLVGRLVYWALRLGNPWITRLPRRFGFNFPKLTNHFFVLQPDASQS